jgi:hypothetical protein
MYVIAAACCWVDIVVLVVRTCKLKARESNCGYTDVNDDTN